MHSSEIYVSLGSFLFKNKMIMTKVNVTTARKINNKRNLLKIGNLLINSFENDVVMVTEHISGDRFSGVVIKQGGGQDVIGTHCDKLFINRFEQYEGIITIEVGGKKF